jgi:hypothetical protein
MTTQDKEYQYNGVPELFVKNGYNYRMRNRTAKICCDEFSDNDDNVTHPEVECRHVLFLAT